jgi:hypothetical protein
MKTTIRIIAMAFLSIATPIALLAQPPTNTLMGAWKLTISGQQLPGKILAVSLCDGNGNVVEISNQPFPSILGIGLGTQSDVEYGRWVQMGNRRFRLMLERELPGNRFQRVDGIVFLSELGDEVTGSAEARFQSDTGTVLYSTHVDVVGKRVPRPSHLTAMR